MYGATLSKTMINAYLKLKRSGFVMRGLQPSTTFISEDARSMHFTDLLSATIMGIETKHEIRCSEPYNCLSDYRGLKWAASDQLLDVNGLACMLMEINTNTEVVVSCGTNENLE